MANFLRGVYSHAIPYFVKGIMPSQQEQFDDAMYDFSRGDLESAIGKFRGLLSEDPTYFDAQLSLGMAYYRKGDYAAAIAEGHKAEQLRPKEQLVHTNLSLFYLKAGDKTKAEHHGLQARIASWRDTSPTGTATERDPELEMAKPAPPPPPAKFPEMPWKKKPQAGNSPQKTPTKNSS
jgi:tetratricopeptide (TPR) repeat protein